MHEFYANAVKKLSMPALEARHAVNLFNSWRPGGMSMHLIERSWYWMDKAQLSYWDGLILASAEHEGCRWLVSEDFQAGRKYGNVEVINPFETAPPEATAAVSH